MRTQTWEIGQTVRVGFLTLQITSITRHGLSVSEYRLISSKGIAYTFTPYQGLKRIDNTFTCGVELPNRGE